ncbi:oligosaccharide flippase family protein [Sphingomicrobium sp. XHP0239]|uniref:oligosaccharide flippase family protein n=1 Tax=Sphingomicrobium maritimum TaxID=3133972 RepID=UPI0031CCA3F1
MTLARGDDRNIGRMVGMAGAQLFSAKIVRLAITVGATAVLARLLTPADFGIFAIVAVFVAAARAVLEGLIDVPAIRDDDLDAEGLANLIWTGMLLMAGLGLLLVLLGSVAAETLGSANFREVLPVTALCLLIQPFTVAGTAVLRRTHRFAVISLTMPITGFLFGATAIALALLDFGFWSLVLADILVQLVTMAYIVVRSGISLRVPAAFRPRRAFSSGGASLVTKTQVWAWANLDTLFASIFLGPTAAGIYSRAYSLTTQMKEPFGLLEQVVRQAFVGQRTLDDDVAAANVRNGLRLITLVSSLMAGAAIALREPVVAVLLGAQWGAVVLPFTILAAVLPLKIARSYLDGFSYARGSIVAMQKRNWIVLTIFLSLLLFFADEGVSAIAWVVGFTYLIAPLFVGDKVDRRFAGNRVERFAIMLPSWAMGAAIALTAELPSRFFTVSQNEDWMARFLSAGFLCAIALWISSRYWLPMIRHKTR